MLGLGSSRISYRITKRCEEKSRDDVYPVND